MNSIAKTFSLSACALATAVLISACGGGTATDNVPPTVVITNNVAASTATGPVTFTFTFSEDVGNSFVVEDIAVTGGTAGTLTKVSSTVATLVVTPTANATGQITIDVAAAKFKDIALNDNVTAANASKAFDTVAAPSAGTVVANFDTAIPGVRGPDSGGTGTITTTPPAGGGSGSALAVLRLDGQPWALNVLDAAVPITADRKTLSARVYSPTAGIPIKIKLEADTANTGDVAANEAVVAGWQTLTWTFSTADPALTYNVIVLLPNIGTVDASPGKTYYFDDITLLPAAATTPVTPPTVTGTVVANFDTAIPGVRGPDSGGTGTITTTPPVGGGSGSALAVLRLDGQPWALNVLDATVPVTADRKTLSARVYSPTAGIPIKIKLEAGTANTGDVAANEAVVAGWQTLTWTFSNADPALTYNVIVLLPNIGTVDAAPGKTYYFDDITLLPAAGTPPASGGTVVCGTTEPTCAPTTVIPADALTIYSEASATAGFNAFPGWGQATLYSEATLAGNKSLKYTNLNYEGIEFTAVDVSAKGKVHFDFWSPDITSLDVFLISAPNENAVTKVLVTKGWNSVDIDLSQYNVPDLKAINQIKLVAAGSGTVFVDNIYFWGTPSAPAVGTPNPSAAAGSAGPVTLPLLTGDYLNGFGAAGNGVFAGDFVGGLDANGNHATWATGTSRGDASNGNIGYFQDNALSSSSQKLEENGWIAGLIDNAGGVPSFFRYFILTAPASTFTNSYMGLFANAPNNGTVDVSSFGSVKFRLWGPAEMYQDPAFSPTLEMKLTGPKVAGCTATGSGATEIKKTFVANQKIGAASTYTLSLAGWTVAGVCGTDTSGTAVASVLSKLAQVVVTVPGTSFNFTHANAGGTTTTYTTGVNLGPIIFTAN